MPPLSQQNRGAVVQRKTKSHQKRAVKMVPGRMYGDEENMVNNEDWTAKAGAISQAFNKLLSKSSCKLCSVYVDEQVEFENRQEDYKTTMAKVWLQTYQPSMEVELYRQFLFDEESVVDSVTDRDEEATVNAFEKGFANTRRISDEGTVSTQKSG